MRLYKTDEGNYWTDDKNALLSSRGILAGGLPKDVFSYTPSATDYWRWLNEHDVNAADLLPTGTWVTVMPQGNDAVPRGLLFNQTLLGSLACSSEQFDAAFDEHQGLLIQRQRERDETLAPAIAAMQRVSRSLEEELLELKRKYDAACGEVEALYAPSLQTTREAKETLAQQFDATHPMPDIFDVLRSML